MNQGFSWTLFGSGLVVFLTTVTQALNAHHAWGEFVSTYEGNVHLILIIFGFIGVVVGAFGVQLPRDSGKVHSSRSSDPKDLKDVEEKDDK